MSLIFEYSFADQITSILTYICTTLGFISMGYGIALGEGVFLGSWGKFHFLNGVMKYAFMLITAGLVIASNFASSLIELVF